MSQRPAQTHLTEATVARFIDGIPAGRERAEAETHLAECSACRAEVGEVQDIIRTVPRPRVPIPFLGAAAAAAIAAILLLPRAVGGPDSGPVTRDPALSSAPAPRLIQPIGTVSAAGRMTWTRVPDVLRYRVTLYDADGQVLWQAELADTVSALPGNLRLVPALYYWQVKAETSPGRWVESELTPFTLGEAPGR